MVEVEGSGLKVQRHRLRTAAIASVVLLVSARAGLVETVKPVDPFESKRVQPVKSDPVPQQGDLVRYRYDTGKTSWGAKKAAILKGNVQFWHEDSTLKSEQVDYDEAAKVATCPGKVSISNPECDVTGDKGTAFFKKRLGVVEGNVVVLLKPRAEPGEKEDKDSLRTKFRQPTTITCPKVEYLYKKKIATATGGVQFTQGKRTARADKAVYDQNKELLVLTGNIKGTDEDGQQFESLTRVTISMKRGDEWMEAENATATFRVDVAEEEEPEP